MPQIVWAKIGTANVGSNAFEIPAECLNDEISSEFVCKNQIIRIAPHTPGAKPVLCLPYPLGSKVVKRDVWRLYDARLAVLGAVCDGVGAALCLGLLQLLADGEPPTLEVYAVPTEA